MLYARPNNASTTEFESLLDQRQRKLAREGLRPLDDAYRAADALQLRPARHAPSFAHSPRFTEVSPCPIAAVEAGTCVVNGRFYTIGGFIDGLEVTTAVHSYDPETDTWRAHADMPEAVTHFNAAVQDDRYVWFAGGYAGAHPGHAVRGTWRYDTVEDVWASFTPLPELRATCGCAIVDNRLHLFGGLGADRTTNFDDHWVLDLDDPTAWTTAAAMPNARGHFGTAVIDGKIYAIGGQFHHDVDQMAPGESTADLDLVHCYDPATDEWAEVRYLNRSRSHMESGTFACGGRVLIVGGRNNSPDKLPRHLNGKPWMLPVKAARKLRRALRPGMAYLSGMNGLDSIETYDPQTDRWTELGRLPLRLYGCSAGVVGNKLIVTHGIVTQTQGKNSWTDLTQRAFVAELD